MRVLVLLGVLLGAAAFAPAARSARHGVVRAASLGWDDNAKWLEQCKSGGVASWYDAGLRSRRPRRRLRRRRPRRRRRRSRRRGAATGRSWDLKAIVSPDGSSVQRIEGQTRKTWKFNDIGKDRVQVALESEGRPVHADIQLWIGPDWTPFSLKTYSEDGKARPIKHARRHAQQARAMIEVQNKGEQNFPIKAASGYASDAMAKVPAEIPAMTEGVRIDGNALRSWPVSADARQVEVVLHTDGRQLNAKIELLNAPNNPKQVYEVFTNNGDLNRLVVCFDVPDAGNTPRGQSRDGRVPVLREH